MAPDARLVKRIQRGDSVAFEQLHARHQPDVLAFCRHLTGNREDAEDAVQHTFLAAYRRIAESQDQLELRPWLFTVARNRCLSLLRARRSAEPIADRDQPVSSFDGLAREVESRQELRDLVRDMGRLPEPQRAALVLSQLDALSYREIGAVLDVAPEKVKALVFQARSSLASAREARDTPCLEIRGEIATARGSALRRRRLRRHVGECEGCREFEAMVRRQRHDLDVLLPAVPSAGLGQAILGGALGREAAGSAGTGLAVGGGASSLGTLATLGLGGVAKLAIVVAVAGGGAAGALAADVPERLDHAAPWRSSGTEQVARQQNGGEAPPAPGQAAPRERAARPGGPADESAAADPPAASAPGGGTDAEEDADGADGDPGSSPNAPAADGREADLPPGLAKREQLPPGLAKRETLPPGLAKRDGAAPGESRPSQPGAGGAPPNGKAGGAPGNGAAGGQGNGGGGGQGNGGGAGGQGNGGGAGAGQGNAGGQGNGNGNAGGPGNGNAGGNGGGNPH